ncbi:phosphatidylinositol 4-phosphate 5-kinase type-1 beta isoform X5 [Prionailurus iriomotensis]
MESASIKGLPSSSTFTLEEGTIYLTSESNALEMQDDNASVLDVYLISENGDHSTVVEEKFLHSGITQRKSADPPGTQETIKWI